MTDKNLDNIFGDDYEVEGQLSIYDYIEESQPAPMIAVSKIFARCIKQMSLSEWKTFVYALMHIKWTEKNKRKVRLDKKELIRIIGLKTNPSDISTNLKRSIGDLWKNSHVEFSSEDSEVWESGCIITRIRCYKDYVLLVFEEDYMPLFEQLDKDKQYITLWSEDLFMMTSQRSILFYESLRLHSDTRKTNTRIYGIKDLKTMFGIPKDGKGSYMRKDGHFDRPAFEKKVIQPLCDDLQKCTMIQLHILEDGKPWRKVKSHGRVRGYEFSWDVSNRPGIVPGHAAVELQEKVDRDPQIMKIARDVAAGDRGKRSKTDDFHNFTGHDYDFEELETRLLKGE